MNRNIFVIGAELKEIEFALEESGGEVTPEILERLTLTKDEFQDKVGNYVDLYRKMEIEANFLDERIKELEKQKKSRENLQDALKERLKYAMESFGYPELKKLGEYALTFRKSKSVFIYDEKSVPLEYKNIVPETYNPDKKAIAAAINKGIEVEGCSIETKNNLQIK